MITSSVKLLSPHTMFYLEDLQGRWIKSLRHFHDLSFGGVKNVILDFVDGEREVGDLLYQ